MTYRIKRDKADAVFSQYVRLRDRKCMRCGSPVTFNVHGLPTSHQASHFVGRRKEATRFDPDNVDCLCPACHMYLGSHPAEHMKWQIEYKGQEKVDAIILRSNAYQKKDRQAEYLYWKQKVKEISEMGDA